MNGFIPRLCGRTFERFRSDWTDFDEEIKAILQRATDPRPIALQHSGAAAAGHAGMPQESAGTGIRRGDQLNLSGKARPFARALQPDFAFFQRLAQALEHRPCELG